jgi:ribosomal protein S18 acetylase RimI-like enzyme
MASLETRIQQTELVQRRYPRTGSLRSGLDFDLRLMTRVDRDTLLGFAQALPPDDLLYLRNDITDPDVVDRLIEDIEHCRVVTVLAVSGDTVVGEGTLLHHQADWTRHVGQIRLIVLPDARSKGLGRFLAEETFSIADAFGLELLTAQMTTEETGAQAVFRGLGFESIGMLPGYVMTREGDRKDLLMMGYDLRRRGAPSSSGDEVPRHQ